MTRLAIHLLGPPRIERDGVPIKADTRKAIALLAYIAVTGQSHRRAALVNLLWPEYDRTRGRAALRRTLYALRKALDGDWLEVDREEIGLNPCADIWLDVDQFRRHLACCETHGHPSSQVCPACVAPLTEAVSLVRGDFLSGFGLRDSFNFDDWQFFQTDVLRRELAGALERLGQWHSTQREFEPAIGYARRRLALDPLDEAAHCQLMRLYAWSGQRTAALRQYEDCVRILQHQLGVSPQEETTQLHTAIKQDRAAPPPITQLSPSLKERLRSDIPWTLPHVRDLPTQTPHFLQRGKVIQTPVFVARERELAQLGGFLDAALAGQGMVSFVTGDAGCGKTALLHEFTCRSQETHGDLVVAWGHGNAHTGFGDPYLPFREVLCLLTGDVEAQWVAGAMTREQAHRLWGLLPQAAQALVEAGPDLVDVMVPGAALVKRATAIAQPDAGWLAQLSELVTRQVSKPSAPNLQQSALFEQYTQVLRRLASLHPLLLVLDDLQWADGASINLLFHLGRQIDGSRILILAAYRPAEVALGRASGLWRAQDGPDTGQRERHPLEPVVNEFKRYLGDIEVDLERAEGRHFVDALLDSEPNRLGGTFRETLYQHTRGYPLFTVELLQGMKDRGDLVRDADGQWAEAAALNWEALPARVEAVVAERIGRLPERLRDILTVASVEGETFTAEVIATVGGADEQEMVRHLSDTLDRKHRLVSARGVLQSDGRRLSRYRFRHILFQRYLYNSLDAVKRVHLHQAVGTALETLTGKGAGKSAVAEASAVQLARHFQESGCTEKAIDYLRQAGERARGLYANKEAAQYLRRALALLGEMPPKENRREWQQQTSTQLYENLGDILEWTGEHDGARAAYLEALARVPEGKLIWQSQLHRKVGNVWRLQGGHTRALQAYDLAESALADRGTQCSPAWWQERVQIQLERMWMYYWLGRWHEMSELVDKVRSAVEQHGTPSQCISFFLCLASRNNRRDRYIVSEETLAFCQTALAISQESENPSEIAWARFVLGFSQLWYGDLDAAEKQMRAALALADQTGDIVHQSRCLTYLTVLFRKRKRVEKARRYAARSLTAAAAGQMVEYIGVARANLAWVALCEGNLSSVETNGQAALEAWQQLPAGHSSCAFQWTARWPLISVALTQNRTSKAIAYARPMLDGTQQRLPDALSAVVEKAIDAHGEDQSEAACGCLVQAIDLARELGCL